MIERDRVEAGRRARAALAYAGVSVADAARELSVSEATAYRILAGNRKETSWDELWQIADLCGLPREWFGADFNQLWRIVPEGFPVFDRTGREDLKQRMTEELEEHADRERSRREADAATRSGPRSADQAS